MSKKKLCDEYKSNKDFKNMSYDFQFDLPIPELPKKPGTVIYDYTTGDYIAKHSELRPAHYGGANSTYEVFNVLEAWKLDKDFYLGNVIKYIARAGKKDATKELEDLEKALVYLEKRISTLKK